MTVSIVVLGATGDLTSRYLLPALAQVVAHLDGGIRLIGVAQGALDTASFAEHVRDSLRQHAADVSEGVREQLAAATLRAALHLAGDSTQWCCIWPCRMCCSRTSWLRSAPASRRPHYEWCWRSRSVRTWPAHGGSTRLWPR